MANFNKVMLMGNLTRDIELRSTQGGTSIAKFGMAINRKSTTQSGEVRESTCFVDLTAFGKQAEILQKYVTKGSPLFVEGRLEYSTWESQEGTKRNKLEVIVENFQFLGSGRGSRGEEGGGGGGGDAPPRRERGGRTAESGSQEPPVDYGDIPF
jgi:single-strand DNA-binding protein